MRSWKGSMVDFLDTLALEAARRIGEGYYGLGGARRKSPVSLKESVIKCEGAAIIAEVKRRSPSRGALKRRLNLRRLVSEIEEGGGAGISILTEPKRFGGSLKDLERARKSTSLPLLMKDIIISPIQVEAAANRGADAVLLIKTLYERSYSKVDISEMIDYAHSLGLEVLLETHTEGEFRSALNLNADLIGINNRDLRTLNVSLDVSRRILSRNKCGGRIVVSESGIKSREDVKLLYAYGARAFLVGSSIMLAKNVKEKIKELASVP